jgi:hypothetical protein
MAAEDSIDHMVGEASDDSCSERAGETKQPETSVHGERVG